MFPLCLPLNSGGSTLQAYMPDGYFMLDTGSSPLQYGRSKTGRAKVQMPLSEFEKQRVERVFTAYCGAKAPHHISDRFRVEFEIRGGEVKLFESRPDMLDRGRWVPHKVARFRKNVESNLWQLYYSDRKGRWRLFEPFPEDKDIEKLLDEVEKDSSGSFWG